MKNKLNIKFPEEHRIFTGIAAVPVHAVRVMPNMEQTVSATKLYIVNNKRDGFFKIDSETYCLIEDDISSFWEVVPVIKDREKV